MKTLLLSRLQGFVDWTRESDVPDQASPKQCSSDTNPERLYRSAVDIAVDNDVECAVDAVENTTRGVFPRVISLPLLTHLPTSIRHGKIRVNHDTRITRKIPNERVRHAYMNMQAVRELCIEKPIKNAFHTQTDRQTDKHQSPMPERPILHIRLNSLLSTSCRL
ncbi:predicted protein [Botrytis cinerea T4]|uniref:Uncharacterized protein n=1 Tax=Botryotinia fuckeliana (strain T4) TaxID=999810 RepID=G2XV04_BOTF4|nr:predicted protein [Botrytis cinerea T4]